MAQNKGTLKLTKSGKHTAIVIFGATGDLTHRMLIPSIYNLFKKKTISNYSIIGFARREKTDDQFRKELHESMKEFAKEKVKLPEWNEFSSKIYYHKSDFEDDEGFKSLKKKLSELKADNAVYYLATLPTHFEQIACMLGKHELNKLDGWTRLIVEKPFGQDLKSAKKLNAEIKKVFKESQIYRIDHVLGKELVQNVLVLRFTNLMFERLWNNRHIDHVQITFSESIGIEDRGLFYEKTGALKDMVQNHMLQLLCLVAMEPPVSLDPEDIKDEKVKVLRALEMMTPQKVKTHVVRGQYGKNKSVKAYREENNVDPNSNTETYVALKLHINNTKWTGVPFYMRTGKRMPKKATFITIVFKELPCVLFCSLPGSQMISNKLSIRIQPEEGMQLNFNLKKPGNTYEVGHVKMDFSHNTEFGPDTPESYERLIHDVINGDSTLFTRSDEVEYAWNFIDQIQKAWEKEKPLFPNYEAGTEGPKEAEELIKKDGRKWEWP